LDSAFKDCDNGLLRDCGMAGLEIFMLNLKVSKLSGTWISNFGILVSGIPGIPNETGGTRIGGGVRF